MKNKKYKVLDLFSGIGGFSLGFKSENFEIIEAVEFNKKIAKIYRHNFDHEVKVVDIKKYNCKHDIDVIIGGPPCQGFSMAGNIGRKFIDDPRNSLYKEFVRIVNETKPKIFIMENVARMSTHNKGETLKAILEDFKKIGFNVEARILNSVNYGVPQNRRRTIIIGSKKKQRIIWPEKNKKNISVYSSISDLPSLKSNQSSKINSHYSMNHTEQMLEKMKFVKDGGNRMDIPKKIRPKTGDARKYIRFSSNKPSVTITGDMRKVFHYNQNRALTPRELMRIQSFPDEFLVPDQTSSIVLQQAIGNAVPVKLASALAEAIKLNLKNYDAVFPKNNYIGNKKKVVDKIMTFINSDDVFADVFAGGGSVAWSAKKIAKKVFTNDALYGNYVFHKAFIENNNHLKFNLFNKDINPKDEFFNLMKEKYFKNEIKELYSHIISANKKKSYKKYIYLSAIRRAMIRKMPYSRFNIPWKNIEKLRDEDYSYARYSRRRSYHNEDFKKHIKEFLLNENVFISGKSYSYNLDAFDFIKKMNELKPTIVYLDPPYPGTMNSYNDFYSIIDFAFGHKPKFKTDFTKKFNSNFSRLINDIKKIESVKKILISLSEKNMKNILEIKKNLNLNIRITKIPHNYKLTSKVNKNNNEIIIEVYLKD